MPTPRSLFPPLRPGDELIRLNGNISLSDKRTVLAACADDGIFTLITTHAFKQTADFIRANNIVSYDPASFKLLTDFICNRTDPCAARTPPVVDDARTAPRVQRTSETIASIARRVGKSNSRRTGFKTGEVQGSGD